MRQLHKLAHTKDKLTKDIEVKMRGDYDQAEKVVHVMYTVGLCRAQITMHVGLYKYCDCKPYCW